MVIKTFAETIKSHIRESDLFARYGGDEFVAIFFSLPKEDIQKKMNSTMRKFESNPLIIDNNKIIIKFSYGIANFTQDTQKDNNLFIIADERMYQHKKSKKRHK